MLRFDSVIEFALQRYYQLDSSNFRVRHENIIPEDKEHILNTYDKGVDRWITRNEARAADEADAVKGADQLFTTIQQIPIEDASAPVDSTSSFKRSANKGTGIFVRLKGTPKKKDSSPEVTAVQAERFRISLMRNQARYEKLFRRKLDPIFKAMQHDALDNLEAHASAMKVKASGQQLFDDAEYDQQMTAALQPLLRDLATTQGALALVFAGEDAADFNLSAPILSILQKNTARMASDFNDQTIADLAAMLADGIANGEGIEQLRARVEEVFQNVKGYRAERIARTETLKTSNQATLWAYRQTGYVTAKIWVVNPGACEQCSYFDGKTVGLESNFLSVGESYTIGEGDDEQIYQNLYADVEAPPLHPNCRCTIIPSREQA
jgi:SPP1 gp7 family putative phage head morphogenesis protein